MKEMLICASLLATHTGELLSNGAVYIKDGVIQQVGPAKQLCKSYPNVQTMQGNWLLMPAFTNAHDHGRGVSPVAFGVYDDALELWVTELGKAYADAYACAYYEGLLLIRSGVTTVLHSHNPVNWQDPKEELAETVRGYLDAGVRVVICPPYVDQNNLLYLRKDEFLQNISPDLQAYFHRNVQDEPLSLEGYLTLIEQLQIRFSKEIAAGDVVLQLHPAGLQWCSDNALKELLSYAKQHNMQMHMHMLETKYQRQYGWDAFGQGSVKHLEKQQLLDERFSLAHMIWLEDDDANILSQYRVKVVHNPSSNLRLRSGTMPLQALHKAGVCCALGMDGCALDDDQDFLREIRLANLNSAQNGMDAKIQAAHILQMATENGAAVAGVQTGCLQPGKEADLVLIDLDKLCFPFTCDDVDSLELLLTRGSKNHIHSVFKRGECLLQNGLPVEREKSVENAALLLQQALKQVQATSQNKPSKEEKLFKKELKEHYKRCL